MPSRNADAEELLGIGSALGAVGAGAFGMNSDFDDEAYELALDDASSRKRDRPSGLVPADRPLRRPGALAAADARPCMRRAPRACSLTAQIAGRPIGVMMGIGTALNPFTVRPSYKQLESLPIAEQRRRLRDPEVRRQILAEQPSDAEVAKLAQFRQSVVSRWDKFFVMGDPPDYEPAPGEEHRRDRRAQRAVRPTRSPTTTSPRPTTGTSTSRW